MKTSRKRRPARRDFVATAGRRSSAPAPKGPAKPDQVAPTASAPDEVSFAEVVDMIQQARGRALSAVNTALVDLYWRIGEYISRKLEAAAWGEGVVEELARYIQRRHPGLRGFTRPNLFRMRQFYETYRGGQKVSALLRQLPWTHHLMILGRAKRPEERDFYIRLAAREQWSSRELERQLEGALFERAILNPGAGTSRGADRRVDDDRLFLLAHVRVKEERDPGHVPGVEPSREDGTVSRDPSYDSTTS